MISDQDLLQAVKEETSEEFVVYGELGREKSSRVALLALERATKALVVLIVTSSTANDGAVEYDLEVRTELDARVPDVGTFCVACGTRLRPWGRFCQHCGLDVLGHGGTGDTDTDEMRAAVEEAITGDYELLGEMRRKEGGGRVYFAREKSSGRIAALRLSKGSSDGEYELGETKVMKKSRMSDAGMSLSVTQLLRPLEGSDHASPEPRGSGSRSAPPARESYAQSPPRESQQYRDPQPRDAQPQRPMSIPREDPSDYRRANQSAPNTSDGVPNPNPGQGAGEWARNNRGTLTGVGVAALVAILGWLAIKG